MFIEDGTLKRENLQRNIHRYLADDDCGDVAA